MQAKRAIPFSLHFYQNFHPMKHVVVTGSTSGIGFGLADSFLALGCTVTISGRSAPKLDEACELLGARYPSSRLSTQLCDVIDYHQVQQLWDNSLSAFGKVDIWINNAGIGHPETAIRDLEPEMIKKVVDTNVVGAVNGAVVALKGMLSQGWGSIYNMEGLGSSGPMIRGLALYGTTKSGLSYFTRALAKETGGTGIIAGAVRPGMVLTKLITDQYKGRPEEWERFKRIFNILGDRVETVSPWLARQILNNRKNGRIISWMGTGKAAARFMSFPFSKRRIAE